VSPLWFVACTGGGPDTAAPPVTYAPVIRSVDRLACVTDPRAGEVWELALTATDPQGAATLATATVAVRTEAGNELARYPFACDGGACAGTFRADYDGVGCALEGTVAFVFTVTDATGQVSAAETVSPW
jgi:hypothetical protein